MIDADSANLTSDNLGMVAAWMLADILPGTLMVKLGLANYKDREDSDGNAVFGEWQLDAKK